MHVTAYVDSIQRLDDIAVEADWQAEVKLRRVEAEWKARDNFRQSYPFVLADGRRFRTLACAGHSLANAETGKGIVASNRPVIEETREIDANGVSVWHRREIPKWEALSAYRQECRRYVVPVPELP